MAKICYMLVIMMIVITISGCDAVKTEKDYLLLSMIDQIKSQVEKNEWEKVVSNVREFEGKYDQRKWKLQLLGEVDEYQSIELEIEKLKDSAQEKDLLESKQGLSQIKVHMNSIYSL